MSLDIELFIKDAIEKAMKEKPDYDMLSTKMSVKIENGRISIGEWVDPSESLR
jgi:hypothetical protein